MNESSNKKPLIILATYWNEQFWIDASLAQIKVLEPTEVIICDGCFDPSVPNHSTDGTRERIEAFVAETPNARLISAERKSFCGAVWTLWRGHTKSPWWRMVTIVRLKFLIKSFFMSSYRRNQAITFNRMISLSKSWEVGGWFMAYDADQYYSDEMLKRIQEVRAHDVESGLMIGKELTFFGDFHHVTDEYEKRCYNNMPHRIYSDTIIQPTRGIIRETKSGNQGLFKSIWSRHLYVNYEKTADVGEYMHYKINTEGRLEKGYALGDRAKPHVSRTETKPFTGMHPSIISKHMLT